MHILTLLFDNAGRPLPTEMDGFFEIDSRGLVDLVDLGGDGRAELIRQAFDDGYWITSAYEAQDGPIYTRFTLRGNGVPTTPARGRHPVEDDLSNDAATYSGTLKRLRWADTSMSKIRSSHWPTERSVRRLLWSSSMAVVRDAPNGRTAATLAASREAHTLLNAILRSKLPLEVTGRRRNGDRRKNGALRSRDGMGSGSIIGGRIERQGLVNVAETE